MYRTYRDTQYPASNEESIKALTTWGNARLLSSSPLYGWLHCLGWSARARAAPRFLRDINLLRGRGMLCACQWYDTSMTNISFKWGPWFDQITVIPPPPPPRNACRASYSDAYMYYTYTVNSLWRQTRCLCAPNRPSTVLEAITTEVY